jgi:hypothetical protein
MTSKAAIRTALATAASRGRTSTTHANPGILSALFLFAPLLLGAFVGAPLIGRELETGTFRYAWTQGAGRSRWAIAMVFTGVAVVTVLAGAFGALVAWHDQPLWQAQVIPRLQPSEFPTTGIAIIGWSLAAYAVAILAGLLWRRVLPALATAVLATFGLAFAASKLRLHYSRTRTRHRPLRLPAPARLHPMDQLRARASLLDLPVDRVRLAHSPRPRPHRHHPPAPPTPRRVDLTRTRVALRVPSC